MNVTDDTTVEAVSDFEGADKKRILSARLLICWVVTALSTFISKMQNQVSLRAKSDNVVHQKI